jgi:drug/metabolite transporter, DME family
MTDHQKGLLGIALAGIFWSTGGLFIKWIPLPPLPITGWRSIFALLVFGLIFGKTVFQTNRKMWLTSAFYAGMLLSFVAATKFTTAANAIFLQFTAPIYILLLEPILLKIKLLRINIITVLCCIAGMGLFFLDDFGGGNLTGNLLGLFSGVCFAGFVLGQRANAPETHAAAIFWGNAVVILATFSSILAAGMPDLKPFSMLAFLGIFQIGCAYALFTFGLKRTLAIEASLLAFVEPILNPVWVWLGYGERPSNFAILGGAMILVVLAVRSLFFEKK